MVQNDWERGWPQEDHLKRRIDPQILENGQQKAPRESLKDGSQQNDRKHVHHKILKQQKHKANQPKRFHLLKIRISPHPLKRIPLTQERIIIKSLHHQTLRREPIQSKEDDNSLEII